MVQNYLTEKKVHQNLCCLEPLLLSSLKSIYLLQYQITCRALLIHYNRIKKSRIAFRKFHLDTLFICKSIESSITIPLFVKSNEDLDIA